MEALLALVALIVAVVPAPVASSCEGSALPTQFPNVDWQQCLNVTYTAGGTMVCVGYGTSGTVCSGAELLASCQVGDYWALTSGACPGCAAAPSESALPPYGEWNCAPGVTSPIPFAGICSGVCPLGFTATGAISATCNSVNGVGVWGSATGDLQCFFTDYTVCSSSGRPTLPVGAAYSCPTSTGDYTCTTVCTSGYTAAGSSRLTVTCSSGVWINATGTITCNPDVVIPASCDSAGLPPLPPNATWLCGSLSPSSSTCTSGCVAGYTASSADRVTVTCSSGEWVNQDGTITCLPQSCSNTALPALPANALWNCTASTPSGNSCTSSCASGYIASSTATALCSLGTWTGFTSNASCSLPGCTGNPGASLIVNATWNCPATTPNAGNCTGTCNGGDGGPNPPVAQCDNGTWTYFAGACQPGSKVRYLTVEAPNDFSADFMKYFNEGRAIEWLNAHIEETKAGYKYFVPAILWPYIETQLGISSAWTTDPAKFVSSNRRKLLAEQGKQAITIGFQLTGSSNGGFLSSVVDAAIDKVLQSRVVLVGLTGFIVRQAELLQEPYPGYDYSTVAIGFSDPAGVIESPVTPVDCSLFLDANISSYLPANFRQNLPTGVEQKLLANQASVCMGVAEIKATFPIVAPHPENIVGQVALSAVVKQPGPSPVDIPGVVCQVTPGSVPGSNTNYSSQSTLDVTCKKSDGSNFTAPNSFLIVLLGSFTCNNANLTSSAAFQVDVAAGFQLTAGISQRPTSVCSSDQVATAEFNYTLDAAAGSTVAGQADVQGTAITRNANAKCTVKVTPGTSTTGKALVTCTGNFTAANNIKVQLTLSATKGGCTSAASTASTSVPVVCCATGASYARQTSGGPGRVPCIGHITPGTPARRCTTNTDSNGYLNNQGPGQATLYYTASKQQCPGKIGVASLTVTCTDQNTLAFTLRSTARRGLGNNRFVYVSCSKVLPDQACPGVNWLKIGGKQAPATNTVNARGAQIVQFDATIAAGSSCTCSTAYWAVYTAGTFSGLPRSICTA